MVNRGKLFVIDTRFLFESSEQAFFDTPLLKSNDGQDQTVVFGFTRDLFRLRNLLGISSLVCVFHSDGQAVSSADNFSRIVTFMRQLQLPLITCENKGSPGLIFKHLGRKARWIISRDMALTQLVSDDCQLLIPKENGEFLVITIEYLKRQLGIRPDQVPSFLVLHDEKNPLLTKRQVKKFLEDHGSLENALNGSSNTGKTSIDLKVHQNREALLKRLFELRINNNQDPSVDHGCQFSTFPSDLTSCENYLKQKGFYSLARLLPLSDELSIDLYSQTVCLKDNNNYQVVDTDKKLSTLKQLLSHTGLCAVDTETSGKEPRTATLYGISLSIEAGSAFYIPLVQTSLNGITPDNVLKQLSLMFTKKIKVIGHNLKYDFLVLRNHGIEIGNPYFDTMLAAYDCFGDSDFFNLSHLAKRLLGKQIKRYKDVVQEGETFLDVPFSELVEHACSDADTAFQLYQKLTGELKKRQILDTFFNETMAVMAKLAMMEFSGISIDFQKMKRHVNAISKKSDDIKNKIYSGAGFEFELESLKSINEGLKKQEWFRENFGMRQFSSATIEQLASRHPLIGAIAEYRRLRRRITEGNEIISNASNGKTFPSFNQIRESCGKISSSDPRLDEAIIAGAVADKTLCGNWFDSERAIKQLSILTEDPVLQKDVKDQERTNFLKTDSIVAGLPNAALLQTLVINPSEEALSKQFLVSHTHSYKIRRELESRYAIVFQSLDIFRKDVLEKGYIEHGGQRKYLEGLHSSDLNKRNKALVAAVRWQISH